METLTLTKMPVEGNHTEFTGCLSDGYNASIIAWHSSPHFIAVLPDIDGGADHEVDCMTMREAKHALRILVAQHNALEVSVEVRDAA